MVRAEPMEIFWAALVCIPNTISFRIRHSSVPYVIFAHEEYLLRKDDPAEYCVGRGRAHQYYARFHVWYRSEP